MTITNDQPKHTGNIGHKTLNNVTKTNNTKNHKRKHKLEDVQHGPQQDKTCEGGSGDGGKTVSSEGGGVAVNCLQ